MAARTATAAPGVHPESRSGSTNGPDNPKATAAATALSSPVDPSGEPEPVDEPGELARVGDLVTTRGRRTGDGVHQRDVERERLVRVRGKEHFDSLRLPSVPSGATARSTLT